MRTCIGISIWVFTLILACSVYAETPMPGGTVVGSEDILFGVNSVELNEQAKSKLIEIAGFLNKNPEKNIIIEGYSDQSGSASLNYELGLKRGRIISGGFQLKSGKSCHGQLP